MSLDKTIDQEVDAALTGYVESASTFDKMPKNTEDAKESEKHPPDLETNSSTHFRVCTIEPCAIEPYDILCGRSKLSHSWIGNRVFRKIIERYRETYQSSSSRIVKTKITHAILSKVRESGGRFLKHDKPTGKWFLAASGFAYEKVTHALRSAKDPNRPRRFKRKTSRIFDLTPEQEGVCDAVLEDQLKFFEVLKELEPEGKVLKNDELDRFFVVLEEY